MIIVLDLAVPMATDSALNHGNSHAMGRFVKTTLTWMLAMTMERIKSIGKITRLGRLSVQPYPSKSNHLRNVPTTEDTLSTRATHHDDVITPWIHCDASMGQSKPVATQINCMNTVELRKYMLFC